MDGDFRAPAKLWVFQTLLLIEVEEKMYSTRLLHERAQFHSDTTLTLIRRSGLLIGHSAGAPPTTSPNKRPIYSGPGSINMTTYPALIKSWAGWVQEEATRRVVFAFFMLESAHAAMFARPATMTAQELRLSLPCDDALWSAASAAEVVQVQSRLQASGVNLIMFLDGLKQSLEGRRLRTNAFARSVIIAGFLNVLCHLNQRELHVYFPEIPQSIGDRDKQQ